MVNFVNVLKAVSCTVGDKDVNIPTEIQSIVSLIINLIKIGVPILLIVFGMLDLGKAVMAQKEDEIKKGQQTFIRRILAAAIVFFVVFIVQMIVSLVAGDDSTVWKCVKEIIGA